MSSFAQSDHFTVRFWGVRGSIACSGPRTARYGGNTSSIEVRCGERMLMFDAGTGLRYLGTSLADNKTPLGADLRPPATRRAEPTLATVAHLVPHKGQAAVIRALAALRDRHPRLRYVVIGKGPEREAL